MGVEKIGRGFSCGHYFTNEAGHEAPAVCEVQNPKPVQVSSAFDRVKRFVHERGLGAASSQRIIFSGDNNQSYYHWRMAAEQGVINQAAVLIVFDAHLDAGVHSDRFINQPPESGASAEEIQRYTDRLSIASFISAAVYDSLVSEIYWVLPSWSRDKVSCASLDGHQGKLPKDFPIYLRLSPPIFAEVSDEQIAEWTTFSLHTDPASSIPQDMIPNDPRMQSRDAKKIMVRKRYLDDLPHRSELAQDAPIIIDFHQDSLDNTGFDTHGQCQNPKHDLNTLTTDVEDAWLRLSELELAPSVVTVSASPEYTTSENADELALRNLQAAMASGVLVEPQVSFGRPSYSVNVSYLANSLLYYAWQNFQQDPRLHTNFSVGLANIETFLLEEQNAELRVSDETSARQAGEYRSGINRIKSRGLPVREEDEVRTLHFESRHYDFYYTSCMEYGLLDTCDMLSSLMQNHQDLYVDPAKLYQSYVDLFDQLKPMLLDY